MSQIQASLKELAAGIDSLASRGQGSSSPHQNPHIQFGSYGAPSRIAPIGLLAEMEEEIAEAKPKEAKSTSSAPAAKATPIAPAILAKAMTMALPQHLVVNASCKDGENFTSQSLEGLDVSDFEHEEGGDEEQQQSGEEEHNNATKASSGAKSRVSGDQLDKVDEELKALKLQYQLSSLQTSYAFVKASNDNPDNDDDDDDKGAYGKGESWWVLKFGSKVRASISMEMQLKMFGDQHCVDFVSSGVWALEFPTDRAYWKFVTELQNYLFENVYGLEALEENKIKIYGEEFISWVKPEEANDSVWEDADDGFRKTLAPATPVWKTEGLMEEFEEAANGGVQSLTLGALEKPERYERSGLPKC